MITKGDCYLLNESLNSLWVSIFHLHLVCLCLLGVPMLEHCEKDIGSCSKNLFMHRELFILANYCEICKIFSGLPEVRQVSRKAV